MARKEKKDKGINSEKERNIKRKGGIERLR